ncbi:unnamed protein product, partial [Oppiella nova]
GEFCHTSKNLLYLSENQCYIRRTPVQIERLETQWNINQGKCGVCGDPYNARVRDNELPNGKYTKNLMITRTYKTGSTIYVKVHVIKNNQALDLLRNDTSESHTGAKEVTQQCLNQNILEVMGSSDKHRWVIPTKDNDVIYAIRVKLPVGLTCDRCVFQWTWITCDHGSGSRQNTHKACADVMII